MSFFTSKLKKFDVHTKTVDGVNQQTIGGAILTVACVLVVAILATSEVSTYMSVNKVNHLVMDQSNGAGEITLKYNIDFHNIPCSCM
jgi:hypothetical protein